MPVDLPHVAVHTWISAGYRSVFKAVERTLQHVRPGQIIIGTTEITPEIYSAVLKIRRDNPGIHTELVTWPQMGYEQQSVFCVCDAPRMLLERADPWITHFMKVQWDGFPVNDEWDPHFLDYDFIGAPWPGRDVDWTSYMQPPGPTVGNDGFSIASIWYMRGQLEIAASLDKTVQNFFPNDLRMGTYAFDFYGHMFYGYRQILERRGLRIAPPDVAIRFSIEQSWYKGSFGFHGRGVIKHLIELGIVSSDHVDRYIDGTIMADRIDVPERAPEVAVIQIDPEPNLEETNQFYCGSHGYTYYTENPFGAQRNSRSLLGPYKALELAIKKHDFVVLVPSGATFIDIKNKLRDAPLGWASLGLVGKGNTLRTDVQYWRKSDRSKLLIDAMILALSRGKSAEFWNRTALPMIMSGHLSMMPTRWNSVVGVDELDSSTAVRTESRIDNPSYFPLRIPTVSERELRNI